MITNQAPVEQTAPAVPTNNNRKILALWLLIGPTALIIGSILLFAIVNFLFSSQLNEGSVIKSIINIILFLAGAISVVTWLPGIIAGIILLTTQKKS